MSTLYVISASNVYDDPMTPYAIIKDIQYETISRVVIDYLKGLGYSRMIILKWQEEIVQALLNYNYYDDRYGDSEIEIEINEAKVI